MLICYIDENNNRNFDVFDSIQSYHNAHPNCPVKHMFKMTDSLVLTIDGFVTKQTLTEQNIEEQQFNMYAQQFSFSASEYKARIQFPNHDGVYELYGFNPRNTRHKCLLREITTHKSIKSPPEYIRRLINKQIYNIQYAHII